MNKIVDPRFKAALDLVRRTGAQSFQLRYSDDEDPTIWMAVGTWSVVKRADGRAATVAENGKPVSEVSAALNPLKAVMRLLDTIIDGGECTHCHRPTGVSDNWDRTMPLGDVICWYQYDPELKTFRRGCEGDG